MNNTKGLYVYPKLPAKYTFIIRFFGSGLANCLFIYARAVILAEKYRIPVLNPDWFQFNIGPYLRNEPDKRHYYGLFKRSGVSGFNKYWLLLTKKKTDESAEPFDGKTGIIVVQDLKNYFVDLQTHSELIKSHLLTIVKPKWLKDFKKIDKSSIGIHIRLGDYGNDNRIPFEWYLQMMEILKEQIGNGISFTVFSDGMELELSPILNFPNTRYVNYGSAIADILALSQTSLIIASDSTFSAWAAYLGQVPVLFCKRHFGPVLDRPQHEFVQNDSNIESLKNWISSLNISQ